MKKLILTLLALFASASIAEAAKLPAFPALPKAESDLSWEEDYFSDFRDFYCDYAALKTDAPETWIRDKAKLQSYRNELKLARKVCKKSGEEWQFVGLPSFPKDQNTRQVVELVYLVGAFTALQNALGDAPAAVGAEEGMQRLKDSMPDMITEIKEVYGMKNPVPVLGAIAGWVEAARLNYLRTGK